jgi:hypothetical protein
MALSETPDRNSFASAGRVFAAIVGLILLLPFTLLALAPMLLFLVPVAIVGIPFMIPAFVTGLAAIRGESRRTLATRPRLALVRATR